MSNLSTSNFEITQEQKDLLFGTSLGDSSLSTETGKRWRCKISHSAKQKDYIFHKYEILKPFCGSSPYCYSYKKKIVIMYIFLIDLQY